MKGLRRVFGRIYSVLVRLIYFNLRWVHILTIHRTTGVNKKLKVLRQYLVVNLYFYVILIYFP